MPLIQVAVSMKKNYYPYIIIISNAPNIGEYSGGEVTKITISKIYQPGKCPVKIEFKKSDLINPFQQTIFSICSSKIHLPTLLHWTQDAFPIGQKYLSGSSPKDAVLNIEKTPFLQSEYECQSN